VAFIRTYMTAGDPRPRFLKPRSRAKAAKAAQVSLLLQQLRGRQGPRRLGGRMRRLALEQGDPFRLRMPKFLRKLQPGKLLAKAAPILSFVPGVGTIAAGALAAADAFKGATAPASTLTGPGAPSQDYHDQVPTVSGVTVTPETSGMVYREDDDAGVDDEIDDDQASTDEDLLNQLLELLQ
jgi:hypothetical protein